MGSPRVFMSYSWTSETHERWVLHLAEELAENGVDPILDKWDLKEGQDAHAFMEKMVADPTVSKVLIVSDKQYKEKADKRKGGVGTESQIISSEIYKSIDQTKFVVAVAEKDETGVPYLPVYYTSRIYIDLSDPDLYAKNLEQLLRWIYDKPLYQKPKIGNPPEFLEEPEGVQIGTRQLFRTAQREILAHSAAAHPSLQSYLREVAVGMETLRIKDADQGPFDEIVLRSVHTFDPIRVEILHLVKLLAVHQADDRTIRIVHEFFNDIVAYLDRPDGVNSWREWDYDNFRFIANELFLTTVAILLKNECFDCVDHLCRKRYLDKRRLDSGRSGLESFHVFGPHLRFLDHRNARLKLNRLSLKADLFKERSRADYASFDELIQADLVLFLRDSLDAVRLDTSQMWYPETLVYTTHWPKPCLLFVRCEEKEYFGRAKKAIGLASKEELTALIAAFNEQKVRLPTFQYDTIAPATLTNLDRLDTL